MTSNKRPHENPSCGGAQALVRNSRARAIAAGILFAGVVAAVGFSSCGRPVTRSSAIFAEDGGLGGNKGLDSRVEVLPGELREPDFSGVSGLGGGRGGGTDIQAVPSWRQNPMDPQFCAGMSYGSCLTLVLQIPSAHLQASPGLSALNLIQAAPTYAGMLERACNEGLQVSMPSLVWSDPARGRVLGAVKKSRCVIQSLSDEDSPLPNLAANEIGFKVRFVNFEIAGNTSQTAPAFGTLAFEQSRMEIKFHDARVFARGSWKPVRGGLNLWNVFNYAGVFGTARTAVRFNEDLTFKFNANGTAAYLNSVLAPIFEAAKSGQGLGELGAEIVVVKQAVTAIAAGSNPVVPAIILASVAADAIHDLCTHEASSCAIKGESTNVRDIFVAKVGSSQTLPSETRATLMDGLKYVPYAVLKSMFEQANMVDIERSLELPTQPFWAKP